ncbi:hypothetical protein [Lacrimispora sp.]|nr:hypothetical protein [Lacrimispora sp.]
MGYCKECSYCGANLDPGEHCDCQEKKAEDRKTPVKIVYQPKEKSNVS